MSKNSTTSLQDDPLHIIKGLGRFFYLVDPGETFFPDLSSVPTHLSTPPIFHFLSLICVEWLVLWGRGKTPRINDGLLNLVHGLLSSILGLFWEASLMAGYVHLYNNYRLVDLPWNSVVTWVLAAMSVDFAYYWLHRATHEIHFLWAAHQVHHSSEDYNLSTALRQSGFQPFGSYLFWVSPALFIPPAQWVIHREMNLLWQFWLHTELITSLGPLEAIFNSPSHHRVHHGANRYCLDNNYGGFLIIWDRIFGTFAEEREDGLVYGLVDQPQWFEPIKHQLFYYVKVLKKASSMPSWKDSMYSLVAGPGWYPGTQRLGDPLQVPEKPLRPRYDPPTSPFLHIYTALHFIISLNIVNFVEHALQTQSITPATTITLLLYVFWTFSSIGLLYGNSRWAWLSELVRSGGTLSGLVLLCVGTLGDLVPLLGVDLYSAIVLVYTGSFIVALTNHVSVSYKYETNRKK